MVMRVVGFALVGWLATAGGLHAQSAARPAQQKADTTVVTKQMGMAGMSTETTDQGGGLLGSRPLTVGIGAVAGYLLMMNPLGAAIMGAAMGGMIASIYVRIYDKLFPPASVALAIERMRRNTHRHRHGGIG